MCTLPVFTVTNNWNSVCLAGVTGAALTLLADKEERAYFVAAAEKYNVYGMKGYADDGYCSEGVGYYNYGFRAYILLREEVCRDTCQTNRVPVICNRKPPERLCLFQATVYRTKYFLAESTLHAGLYFR